MTLKVHATLYVIILLKCELNHTAQNTDEPDSVTYSDGT